MMMNEKQRNEAREKLKGKISRAYKAVSKSKDVRKAANDEIAEVRSSLEAAGVPKKAFDMAMRYCNMDPDDRQGFDLAYDLCRDAMGLPYNAQGDFIQWLAEQRATEDEGEDENTSTAATASEGAALQ